MALQYIEPVGPSTDPDIGSGGTGSGSTSAPPSTALPALPVRTPPPVGEPAPGGNAVRLYDVNGRRKRLPDYQIGASRWTVEPKGGFADGTVTLYFSSLADLPNVVDGDCFEIWSKGVRQWRGIASDTDLSEGEPATLELAGYGRILDLERMVMPGPYQEPAPVDAAQMFAMIGADIKSRYPDIEVDSPQAVGALIQTLDCKLQTARQALDSLYEYCAGVAVYGFDVNPATGRDRLYLRKIDTTRTDYTISVPGPNVGKRSKQIKAADVINCVIVEGDTPDYPQLLPNGSFEALVRPSSADGGSLIQNGDFNSNSSGGGHDRNATSWALSSSATFVQGGQGGKPAAFTGGWIAELDTIGEWVEQIQNVPPIAPVPGHSYEFGAWLQREGNASTSNPPQVTITAAWRAGGADMAGQVTTWTVPVNESTYVQRYRTVPCPVGATGLRVKVELTGGDSGIDNHGVAVGYVYAVDVSALKADKWDFRAHGSAQVLAANWRARGAFDGANCLYVKCTATDADNQDLHIRITPSYLADVTGGEQYRFSFRVKSVDSATPVPKLEAQIDRRKADGTRSGGGIVRTDFASAICPDWTYYEATGTMNGDAVKAEAWLAVRGSGEFYLDALSYRSVSVDPAFSDENPDDTTYVPAGNLLAAFRADLEFTEAENAAVHNSVATYGLRERVEHAGGVKTITDAHAFARPYLASRAVPNPSAPIEVYDDARPWTPGLSVALSGPGAALYAPQPLGLLRINGSIDDAGLLTHGLERGTTVPTDEEIVMGAIKRTTETRVSEATGAASPSAPSNTPGASVSAPDPTTTVTSVNGATGALSFEGIGGIDVTEADGVVTIDGSGIESSGGGVTSLNGLGGDVAIINGDGLSVSASGEAVTVGIADGGVGNAKLANSAVTTAKITDSAVTAAKLAANAVTSAAIADNAVGTSEIADHSVTADKLTPGLLAGTTGNYAITLTQDSGAVTDSTDSVRVDIYNQSVTGATNAYLNPSSRMQLVANYQSGNMTLRILQSTSPTVTYGTFVHNNSSTFILAQGQSALFYNYKDSAGNAYAFMISSGNI